MKLSFFALLVVFLCTIGANALAEFTLPSDTTVIEEEAFSENRGISYMLLPDGLVRIEAKAFSNCGINGVYLPSSLEYIAENAFVGNSNMKVVAEPDTYAYNWANRKGFIKNEPVGFILPREITIASNANKKLTLIASSPTEFKYFGIDVDGEEYTSTGYSDLIRFFYDKWSYLEVGDLSVGDHTVQFYIEDENWNKTYIDTVALHITQGPTVTLSVDVNPETIIFDGNDTQTISYTVSVQNAGIESINAYYYDHDQNYQNVLWNWYGEESTKKNLSGSLVLTSSDFPIDGEYTISFQVRATNGSMIYKDIIVHKGKPAPSGVSTYAWLTDCYVVSWNQISNAVGYRLYYSTNGTVTKNSPYMDYDADTTTAYFNTTPGEQNYFAVSAIYADGESDLSDAVTANIVTPLPKPASFVLDSVNEDGIAHVHWSAVSGTNNYRFYYSFDPSFSGFLPCRLIDNSTEVTLYLNNIMGASSGDEVYLWVAAQTDEGPGVPSDRLTVTIPEKTHAPLIVDSHFDANIIDQSNSAWGEYYTIDIITEDHWIAEWDADWIELSQTEGTGNASITLHVHYNFSTDEREAEVNFSIDTYESIVTIIQGGQSIFVDPESVTCYKEGTSFTLHITTENMWDVYIPDDYKDILSVSQTTGTGIAAITVNCGENNTGTYRRPFLRVDSVSGVHSGAYCYINQSAEPDPGTTTPTPTPVPGSTEVTVSTGNNSITITAGNVTMCKFVAPSTGTYVFTTTGTNDTVGVLYDASMNQIAENDDVDNDRNFKIDYALTKGQTVYIGVKYWDTSASGTETLSINKASSLTITTHPVSKTVNDGDSVTFSITVTGGTGSYTYQWYRTTSSTASGSTISGATSKNYSFKATTDDDGYYYYCIVSSGSDSVNSSKAKLSVIPESIPDPDVEFSVVHPAWYDKNGVLQTPETDFLVEGFDMVPNAGVEETATLIVTSNYPWSVTMSNASVSGWLSISPTYGSAGETRITLTIRKTPSAGSTYSVNLNFNVDNGRDEYSGTVSLRYDLIQEEPFISVSLNDVDYTAERNSNTGISIQAGSTASLWPAVTFSSGLTRLEVAVYNGGGYEVPVISYQDYINGIRTGSTGNYIVTGDVDSAGNPYVPGFYFPEDMDAGVYWLTAGADNAVGHKEVRIEITVRKGLDISVLGYKPGDIFTSDGFTGPNGKAWECLGFGYYVEKTIFGNFGSRTQYGIAPSKNDSGTLIAPSSSVQTRIKNVIINAGPGAHVRVYNANGLDESGSYGHSFIVISADDSGMNIIQANGSYNDNYEGYEYNKIGTAYWSWSFFFNNTTYGKRGLHWIESH